jgi:hypothetical protein
VKNWASKFAFRWVNLYRYNTVQLLIYAFVELRPAGAAPLGVIVNLLTKEQWRRTFLLLHGAAPSMFNYG